MVGPLAVPPLMASAVNHREKVITAERPWAYLMHSVQRHALDEVRAQQLLTSPTRVRGASRATLPTVLVRVGSTAHDLALAFRHEPSGPSSDTTTTRAAGRRAPDGLITAPPAAIDGTRHGWHGRLVALLVEHGANGAVTGAAFDRLDDVMTSNRPSYWKCAARRDRILQAIGLSPKRASAQVALLAVSRRERRNGRRCGLMHQFRATNDAHTVALTTSQLQRINTYVDARAPSAPPPTELAADTA